jgi:hypothetical protein
MKEIQLMDEWELAKRWSVSIDFIRDLRRTGKGVKFLKLGRFVSYRLCDVEDYENKNTFTKTSDYKKKTIFGVINALL